VVTWPHSVDDIGGFLITWLPIVFFGIIIVFFAIIVVTFDW